VIPLIETGGSAFEIGFDVGRGVREQIHAAAASTRAEFARSNDIRVAERIGAYLSATEAFAPEIVQELRGMAEGSGVPFEELFVMNATAELNQEVGRFEECTVAGVTEHGTANGHVLLGHNEDASAGWNELTYVIRAEPDGAPAFAAFTYAGLLLHQGVNAVGIGSVGNALYARDARPGVPKLFLYRRALAQSTIEDAIRVAITPARAFGNNHLIANEHGDIYDLEVSGGQWAMLHAGNRFLAHTNHFVSPELTHLDAEEDLLNSRLRLKRVERLLDASFGSIDVGKIKAILSDHSNFPKSVCKHYKPEGELDYGTIGSVVIDVTDRTIWACAGYPCRGEWREVRLS
jgi:isopenicillin-N N-acyltransferase-like protein